MKGDSLERLPLLAHGLEHLRIVEMRDTSARAAMRSPMPRASPNSASARCSPARSR